MFNQYDKHMETVNANSADHKKTKEAIEYFTELYKNLPKDSTNSMIQRDVSYYSDLIAQLKGIL